MAKPRLQDAQDTLAAAVVNALNIGDVTTPAQVGSGWPVAPELISILNNGQYIVTIFDRGKSAQNTARHPGAPMFPIANPDAPLVATTVPPSSSNGPWTITFSGSVIANLTVHALVGSPITDAFAQTTGTDSLSSVAAKVAAAVNALDLSGLSATATGDVCSISGTPFASCSIAAPGGVLAQEINRVARTLQVSVWAPNPTLRDSASEAIETWTTSDITPSLALSDGTPMECLLLPTKGLWERDDGAQSPYSAFVDHIMFAVEYGILRTYPAYTIAAVEQQITTGLGPVVTDFTT